MRSLAIAVLIGLMTSMVAVVPDMKAHHKKMMARFHKQMHDECRASGVTNETLKIVDDVIEAKFPDKDPPDFKMDGSREDAKKKMDELREKQKVVWEEAKKEMESKLTDEDQKTNLRACLLAHEKHMEKLEKAGRRHIWYEMIDHSAKDNNVDAKVIQEIKDIIEKHKLGDVTVKKLPCLMTDAEKKTTKVEIHKQLDEVLKEVNEKHTEENVKKTMANFKENIHKGETKLNAFCMAQALASKAKSD